MVNRTSKLSKIVLAVSFLFVLSALSPASFAAESSSDSTKQAVVVVNSVTSGSVVQVTVQNVSKQAATVYVVVDAVVAGFRVRGYTLAFVSARSTAQVAVGFIGSVSGVDAVGINDTDSPF